MPRKTLQQRQNKNTEDTKGNRIAPFLDTLRGTENPDDIMVTLLEILTETSLVPEVGGYYTFIYSPKTPNTRYDEYPLVEITTIFRWGFKGINYHHPGPRQYTWEEIVGSLHKIYPDEFKSVSALAFKKIRLNS
jgi:hypothetical protein